MSAFLTINRPAEYEDLVIDASGYDYGIHITCPDVTLYRPKIKNAEVVNLCILNWDEEITNVRIIEPELIRAGSHGSLVQGRAGYVTLIDPYSAYNGWKWAGHGITASGGGQNRWEWKPISNDEYRGKLNITNHDIRRVELAGDRNLDNNEWYVADGYLHIKGFDPSTVRLIATTEQCHHISYIRPVVERTLNISQGAEGHGVVFDGGVRDSTCIEGKSFNNEGAGYSNLAGTRNTFINCDGWGNRRLFQDIKPATDTVWR